MQPEAVGQHVSLKDRERKPVAAHLAIVAEHRLDHARVPSLACSYPDFAGPTTGVIVGDTLFYVATAQLRAVRPGGTLAPADSMRETSSCDS